MTIRCVTYRDYETDEVQALSVEEFTTNADFSEWVWHDAPSKGAAMSRHDAALDHWAATGCDAFIHADHKEAY